MQTRSRAKPATAAWIQRERKRLGLKPPELAARLEAMGLQVTAQTIQVWESNLDRRPKAENIDGLERIFGSRAPEQPETRGAADPALLVFMERQTLAMERQADALESQASAINRLLDRLELQEHTAMAQAIVAEFLAEHPELSTRSPSDPVPAGERQ